ncbi:hypothetical protein [Novosphingobium rosa]|uniref:hypothetical protein n=1 Tax=Novosphingobium rosa TaxID=76978 RepID=UPI000AE23A9E|nr:hypothetical protein [Novosphingobium rosa]
MDIVQFRCSAGMGYSPFGGVPFEDDQPVRIALAPPASWSIAARRLFTATFAVTVGEETVLWFYACHAASREGVMEGLASRVPAAHLADAQVREGIDPTNWIVRRLVPSGTLQLLAEVGDLCPSRRPLAGGGVVSILEGTG